MDQSISLAHAKAEFSALVNSVAYGNKRYVVLSHGKPKAALIGMVDLRLLETQTSLTDKKRFLNKADQLAESIASHKKKSPRVEEELHRLREVRG